MNDRGKQKWKHLTANLIMNILQVFNLQSFSKLRVKCKNNLQSWVGLFHSWDLGYRHSWELGYKGFELLIKIYGLCFVFLLITAFGDLGSRACISANYNTFPTVNNTLGYILLILICLFCWRFLILLIWKYHFETTLTAVKRQNWHRMRDPY